MQYLFVISEIHPELIPVLMQCMTPADKLIKNYVEFVLLFANSMSKISTISFNPDHDISGVYSNCIVVLWY